MKTFEIKYSSGATSLNDKERAGLIPDYITTHGELNELEQKNIQNAIIWLQNKRNSKVLDQGFVYELHKKMFNDVWKWAGKIRTSGKNIGIDWHQISTQLKLLLDDTSFWIENCTYPLNEIAVRFHHRLVQIHIFPNGNGRHARLVTELLLESNGQKPFTWGLRNNSSPLETENKNERRKEYVTALKAADHGSFKLLLKFVRS